jgi:hypothetical protein
MNITISQKQLDEALSKAVISKHPEIVEMLLKSGANPNSKVINRDYAPKIIVPISWSIKSIVFFSGEGFHNEKNLKTCFKIAETLIRYGAKKNLFIDTDGRKTLMKEKMKEFEWVPEKIRERMLEMIK